MAEEESPFLDVIDGSEDEKKLKLYSNHLFFSKGSSKQRKAILFCILTGVVFLTVLVVFSIGIAVGHFAIPYSQSAGPPCTAPITNNTTAHDICANPPLLLISLDGFWSSYLKRNFTPFLNSLAAGGVRSEYMRSEFPTKTFPNHFSIVTGLHPESHGIVNNYFYDTVLRDKFYIGVQNQNDPKWWLGEPIWITAIKQRLKSAVYFWPGSEVEFNGRRSTYYFPYDSSTSYEQRVNTVLSWLDMPNTTRPQFIAAYFDEPDHSGHQGGPFSDVVNAALSRVDKTVESLFAGLRERGVEDCVNVIIVSDHGMATYDPSKLVHLKDVEDSAPSLPSFSQAPTGHSQQTPPVQTWQPSSGQPVTLLPDSLDSTLTINYGIVADIFAPPGDNHTALVREAYDYLVQDGTEDGKPFRAYHKKNLPLRLHAGHFNRQRYGDIYLIGNEGSYLTTVNSMPSIGEHGYDNILASVQATFIAHGPAFRKGYVSEPFANIELYNLMCGLLGIIPSPNNGTAGSLYHLLSPSLLSSLPVSSALQGTQGSRETCYYPTDESTYNARSFCEECVCRDQCTGVSNATINATNQLLNLNSDRVLEYQQLHLPWGIPSGGEGSSSCLLTQQDYITLYSNTLHIPLWTAFKLTRTQANVNPGSVGSSCLHRDPRIPPPNSSNCTDYTTGGGEEFVPVRLPAAALSTRSTQPQQLNSNLLSSVVPQLANFSTDVWHPLEQLLRSWARNFSTIHIILGSVLDTDRDGKRDNDASYSWWVSNRTRGVAIPTHFYAVVTRCGSDNGVEPADCNLDQLDTVGMLFQHPTEPGDPSPPSKLLRFSLTPIRDIERVTGVDFFPSLSTQQQNTLELRITNELWTTLIQ